MGQLRPGVTYIYERDGDTVFRRESGAVEREVMGYDYRTSDGKPLHDHLMDSKLWGDIHRAAKTNPTLQDALERAIMIYQLSKTNER
jgi:hypothetical protein